MIYKDRKEVYVYKNKNAQKRSDLLTHGTEDPPPLVQLL